MINVHFLSAADAPYTYLLDFDEAGYGNLERHFIAAIPPVERQMSPSYGHWLILPAALPGVLHVARDEESGLRYQPPPPPQLVFPYYGW